VGSYARLSGRSGSGRDPDRRLARAPLLAQPFEFVNVHLCPAVTAAVEPGEHQREHERHAHGGHGHAHGPSTVRSRAGLKAVSLSFGVLGATALVQAGILVLTARVALLADPIHNVEDALTAVPVGIAFLLRSFRAEKLAGLAVVLAIFVSACVALHESIERPIHPQELSHIWVLAAARVVGFVGNELAAQTRLRAGERLSRPNWRQVLGRIGKARPLEWAELRLEHQTRASRFAANTRVQGPSSLAELCCTRGPSRPHSDPVQAAREQQAAEVSHKQGLAEDFAAFDGGVRTHSVSRVSSTSTAGPTRARPRRRPAGRLDRARPPVFACDGKPPCHPRDGAATTTPLVVDQVLLRRQIGDLCRRHEVDPLPAHAGPRVGQ
jgi:hypothetical protein